MNLYDILGVEQNATPADLKAGYRREAKACHPDAGGTVEAFQNVERAYRVLKDPEKRKRYDETGELDERAENDDADAMSVIAAMVERALTKEELKHIDLVADMRKQIGDDIALARNTIAEGQAYIDRAHDARKRLKAKKRDVIGPIIDRKIVEAQRQLANLERQIALRERALVLIEDVSFEFETPLPVWSQALRRDDSLMNAFYGNTMGRGR